MTEYLLSADGPVMLITTFQLADEASAGRFIELWTDVGNLMAMEPGFGSARLYHPKVGGEPGEYVHVAEWASAAVLAKAQANHEIRDLQGVVEGLVVSQRHLLCELAGAIRPPSAASSPHARGNPDSEP